MGVRAVDDQAHVSATGPVRPLRVRVLAPGGQPDARLTPIEVAGFGPETGETVGAAPSVTLHDAVHAVLSEPGGRASRILVVPGSPPSQGALRVQLVVDGWQITLEVDDAERARLRDRATRDPQAVSAGRPVEVRAIIAGRVAGVTVRAGEQIVEGQPVLVLEAMKMQNELRSPRAGRVARITVEPGATVEAGDLLAVIE